MHKKLLISLLLITVSYLGSFAQRVSADDQIKALLEIGEKELTVGDPILVTLAVTHPADYQVIFPEMGSTWGDFMVSDQSAPSSSENADGTKTTSQTIDLRYFSPGTIKTPALIVNLSDSQGRLVEVLAEPIPITISSVLVEGDQQLRDIKPQASLPYINLWPWAIALIGIGMVAGVSGIVLSRQAHLRQSGLKDMRKPHDIAFDELERIEALHLPEKGLFKEHYTLVSTCIRLYMEKRFEIPVIERTTREIQISMKETNIPEIITNQFMVFLAESDLVKFSKFSPDVNSAKSLLESGHRIVEGTIPILNDPISPTTKDITRETQKNDSNINSTKEMGS